MAANEEDYLDGLLKSLSDKENEKEELKDQEEEDIKEQVREAVEKSNESSNQYENIYADDPSENDGKQVSDEHVEKVLKDVMTVPRSMAAPGVEESYIVEDEIDNKPEIIKNSVTPEEAARRAEEIEKAGQISEEVKSSKADKEIDKLLDDTVKEETTGSSLSKDDELVKDMELSDSEKDRLVNMNLDDLISDVHSEASSEGIDNVNELLAQIGMADEADASEESSANKADNSEDIKTKADEMPAAKSNVATDNEAAKKQLEQELKTVGKKKKKSLFSIIKDIFFESLEEPADDTKKDKGAGEKTGKTADNNEKTSDNKGKTEDSKEKDENELLIEEVFKGKDTLDEAVAPKKGLIAKIKYRIQQFKAKQAKEAEAEEQQEEAERQIKQQQVEAKKAQNKEKKQKAAAQKTAKKEQAKKAKANKQKQQQKQKKPKKEKVKQPPKPGDIIRFKPKSVIMFVLLIVSIVVFIQVFGYAINYSRKVDVAKNYYANQEYGMAYNSLSGVKLSGNEETLYKQSKVIMYVQRQYESYENYEKMNMHTEALNALVKGVDRYQTYRAEAKQLGVEDKMTEVYKLIINAFKNTYRLSETDAIALVELSKSDFTSYYYKIEGYGEAIK